MRKTDSNVKRFVCWLADSHFEYQILTDKPPKTLDMYLGEWILSLKKEDGSQYEQGSPSSFHHSINVHLQDCR